MHHRSWGEKGNTHIESGVIAESKVCISQLHRLVWKNYDIVIESIFSYESIETFESGKAASVGIRLFYIQPVFFTGDKISGWQRKR